MSMCAIGTPGVEPKITGEDPSRQKVLASSTATASRLRL